jgi:amino acid transporter
MASPENMSGSTPSTGATASGSTATGSTTTGAPSTGAHRVSGDNRSSDRVDTARETVAPVQHTEHVEHVTQVQPARPAYQPEHRDDSEARDRFGGINWGAGFFGWLVAIGMTIILSGIVGAVVSAIGSQVDITLSEARASAGTIGIGAGITLLVVLMLAYFTGGYVAGRMSRFDGAKQGLATWLIGLVVTVIVGLIGAAAGAEYDIFDRISLPRLPLDLQDLGTGGLITAAAVLVGTLLAAVLGGKVGHRYHDKVDRAAGITR